MKPINVCIVVFNRYDLMAKLVASIENSILHPEREVNIYVIDRGHNRDALEYALNGVHAHICDSPGQSLPAAWNWFAMHVPEERIITSDDIEFGPEALEMFATTPGDFVGLNDGRSSHFACFLLRDSCIRKIGLFDESLSPDYLYFEDCDYKRRMDLMGIPQLGVSCLTHVLSASWEKKTPEQQAEHHRRFIIAQNNYIAKWGGLPGHETVGERREAS